VSKDVVSVLEELTSLYPAPTYNRSDNGPEFIADALKPGPTTAAPTRLTSSQDPPLRTALPNHSTAGYAKNSSTPSCSPRWLRSKAWLIAEQRKD